MAGDDRLQPKHPPAFPAHRGEENDLSALIGILANHKGRILSIFLVCILAACAYVYTAPPQYVATTEILIRTSGKDIPESAQIALSPSKTDAIHIRSQAEILKSPDIIRRMLTALPLYERNEFGGHIALMGFNGLDHMVQDDVIRQVSRRLSVKPIIGTSIITVSFRSENPDIAAQAANHIIRSYTDRRQDKIAAENADLNTWVTARAELLLQDLERAEENLRQVRHQSGLSVTTADLSEKQTERLKDDYARLQQQLLENNPAQIDDAVLSAYKNRETALQQEKAELAKRYGAKHPAMIAIEAQLDEAKRITKAHQNDLMQQSQDRTDAIRATMAEMQKKMEELEQNNAIHADDNAKIRRIEAEIETMRALYNRLVMSQKELTRTDNMQDGTIDIIYAAIPPAFPAYPQKILILVLAGITGLFLGIFTALVLESLRKGFYNAAQLEGQTGLPVYAVLPKIKSLQAGRTVSRFVGTHPANLFSEETRTLLTTLRLNKSGKGGGQIVTITSTTTGEGKTSIAAAMANIAAQSDLKVLLIDADMRRPALHKHYGIGNARGLSDYLSNRLPIDDVIYTGSKQNVHVMTTKAIPTHALTLLNSDRMEALLRRTRERYDIIIIDTPSSRYFTDARITSQWSDLTLYIVESGKINHNEICAVLKSFWNNRLYHLALVLNKAEKIRDKSLENAYLKAIDKEDDRMAA